MSGVSEFLGAHGKAFAGAFANAVTVYFLVSADGNMTTDDWRNVVVAAVVGSGLTYLVPNLQGTKWTLPSPAPVLPAPTPPDVPPLNQVPLQAMPVAVNGISGASQPVVTASVPTAPVTNT